MAPSPRQFQASHMVKMSHSDREDRGVPRVAMANIGGAPEPVFVARGLSKSYGSGEATVFALRDLDLDIFEGEFIVLLGPSGSASPLC